MKPFLSIAAALFFCALALPLFQSATGLPPDYPLAGVESTATSPTVSLAAWWSGALQTEIDAWINQRIGLRGFMVRTANQINYSLFRELSKRGGTPVLMGRDGFLFEKAYVDAYRESGTRPEAELQNISFSTRRLQDRLAADGIAFLLVIAPSKAEIYPEHLPPGIDVAGRAGRRSNYENLIEFLRRDGVNLVDAHALFLEWKRAPGAPLLFTKGGTHWNQYGAARVVSQIMDRLRELTGKDLPAIRVVGAETNRVIADEDNDLGELVNLWSGRPLAGPQIHPVTDTRPGTYLPDLLVVGDSFVFTLTNLMDREQLYRRRDTFYYYNRQYFFPAATNAPLDKRQLDLLREIRGRDAIVIEVGEYWLPRIGFGFVRDLLKTYDRLDAATAAPSAP
jgi:hypothetical protein